MKMRLLVANVITALIQRSESVRSLAHMRAVLDAWRTDYNTSRR